MPVVKRAFTNKLINPAEQTKEKWDKLSADKKFQHSLAVKSKIANALGYDMDGPNPCRDKNGNLLLFEIDDNGRTRDPLANGVKADSEEFLKKVYAGKIFAVPVGYDTPLQVQFKIDIDKFSGRPKCSVDLSKPMSETLDMDQEPEKPSLWTRIRHFFGGAKEEYAAYLNKARPYLAARAAEKMKNRDEEFLKQETAEMEKKDKEAREAAQLREKEERRQNIARSPKEFVAKQDVLLKELMNIYGAQPVKKDKYIGDRYTTEEFNTLRSYEIKDLGTADNPISEKEFTGLAVLGALTAESTGELRRHPLEQEEGMTRDEHVKAMSTFFTADLFGYTGEPRPGAGEYFAQSVAPGRDTAAAALREYKNGNKDPLGQLIGKGLRFSAEYMDREELNMNSNIIINGVTAEALNLLERDEELMNAAKAAGMTDKHLQMVKADRKCLEICRANEWAKERLNAAEKGEIQLSEPDKKACIDARVTYETLRQAMHIQHTQNMKKPESIAEDARYDKELDEFNKRKAQIYRDTGKTGLNKEQLLEAGKKRREIDLEGDMRSFLHTYKSKKATGSPEIYGQLGQAEAEGKTVEGLNRMMDELLPGRAALENLSIADLNKALDPTRLFRQDSPYIRAPQPGGPAPEKQVEAPVQEKQAEKKAEGSAVQKEEAPEVEQPAVL